MQFLPLLIFVVIFYFLLIRPQQKRSKETREMQAALAKGDKVVTVGGLQGTVDAIDDQTVVLRAGGSKLTFERNAIRGVLKKTNVPEPAVAEENEKK
ncbi:preprotein translocase subunit YajC [Sporolactobacillus mangiferae]